MLTNNSCKKRVESSMGTFKEHFFILTEGYFEIRISFRESITVMTNRQSYMHKHLHFFESFKTWSIIISPTQDLFI